MTITLRDLLDEHWNRLEHRVTSASNRLRVSDLPVDSVHGELAAAVDHEGRRHLLVPIGAHQRVRRGLEGPVLLLRKRALEGEDSYQDYADLGCLRSDLNDVFTSLCADVLKASESAPTNPLKALYTVLDRWKALFQPPGTPLGAEQLAGLFAELIVLVRLLESDAGAQRLWAGPSGHRHDFTTATRAVEVKASTAAEGRRLRVHGLDQLEAPGDGTLQLAWYRLERVSGPGKRLVDLVDRAVRICEDESALLTLLAQAGYRSADAHTYRDVRFSVAEERWYEVDMSFPRLTGNDLSSAGIPIRFVDVHYTIDLSSDPPTPMDPAQMTAHLIEMLREPV